MLKFVSQQLKAGPLYDLAIVVGDLFLGAYIGRTVKIGRLLMEDPSVTGNWLPMDLYLAAFLLYVAGLFLYIKPLKYRKPINTNTNTYTFAIVIGAIFCSLFSAAVAAIGGGRFFEMDEFVLILLAIAGFFISIFIVPFLLKKLLSLAGKKYGEKEPISSICQKFTGLIFTYPMALLALLPINLLMDEFHISTDKNMSVAYSLALAVPFRALLFAFIAWTMAWPPRKFASLPIAERSNNLEFYGYLVVSYIIQQVW